MNATAILALGVITDRELLPSTRFAVDFRQAAARPVADVALLIFNSLFFVLRGIALALVWWWLYNDRAPFLAGKRLTRLIRSGRETSIVAI